ncbi:PorT family protein [Aequorivita sp. H23M31]|uniref:PorT family protein n=1 Tax=Aequorivita ciconiae TaxID=2494375 RepID=A0A410G002_9FLAO|nr:porin family protein [Aequorivita sp. H23M31]QAA80594.1 PorT family protein [Aequorivita sp. H23M31]
MRKGLLIILVTLFALSVEAQEVRLGIKAGINLATLKGAGAKDFDSKTGINFGGFVEIPVSKNFYLQPELLYSAQGIKAEYFHVMSVEKRVAKVHRNIQLDLHYLNIPIMAKVYLLEGFALEVGPQLGFIISAKKNVKVDVSGELSDEAINVVKAEYAVGKSDVKEAFKTVELGLGFGPTYQSEMGILLGARFTFGFTGVYKDSSGPTQENKVIQFFAGYRF